MTHVLKAYAREVRTELDELLGVNVVLREDIQSLLDAYPDNWGHGTLQRALVRACWAHVDAVVFGLKRITLRAAELGSEPMSADEHKFLLERSFVVDSSGGARKKTEYAETKDNVKRVLKLACTKFNLGWAPDFSGKEWLEFGQSLELRHRVTHPKSRADLDIAPEEIELHRRSFLWFSGLFNTLLEKLNEKHGPSQVNATA
jgi:hypothetical protein